MTLGELSSAGMSIEIALGLIVFLVLCYQIAVQLKAKKKISELEKNVLALHESQAEVFANLENKAEAIKEMLFEKTNPMTSKLNELSRKANAMLERSEALRKELEQKVEPLRTSLDETVTKFGSSQDALRKVVQEGKNEIDKMAKEVQGFAEEMDKMKDFIRERTIDLEL